jgi:hypothetical protein
MMELVAKESEQDASVRDVTAVLTEQEQIEMAMAISLSGNVEGDSSQASEAPKSEPALKLGDASEFWSLEGKSEDESEGESEEEEQKEEEEEGE